MAGYSDFLKRKQTQAQNFLSSGSLDYNPLRVQGSNVTGCQDSSQCASGWACIGGRCVVETSSSKDGSGNLSGCGNGGTSGSGSSECGAGTTSYLLMDPELIDVYNEAVEDLRPGDVLLRTGLNGDTVGNGLIGVSLNGKCLKTGCTGTSTRKTANDACCGKGRCCRMGSIVECFCGECPEPPERCDKFCTYYFASNGTSAAGCNEENTCDECSTCVSLGNFQGTACKKKTGGGPCWCGGCPHSCDKCAEDGICTTDCENCQTCYTTYKYCDSGTVKLECCYSACDYSGGFSTCRDSYECPVIPGSEDPCAGTCNTITVCDSDPDPTCPAFHSCRQSGTITVGSRTCRLFEQCNKSDVPASCSSPDCNCDSECGDCQICNSGVCVTDPACPDCDGPICPQASGGCCDSGETCYRPAPDQDGQACCESGKKLVDIYINEVRMGPSSISSFFSIGGPAQMSLVGPCECGASAINCSGQPVACTDPAARSRLLISNSYIPNGGYDPCEGGRVNCFPYQDSSCDWSDGPFDPVLLDTTLWQTVCC